MMRLNGIAVCIGIGALAGLASSEASILLRSRNFDGLLSVRFTAAPSSGSVEGRLRSLLCTRNIWMSSSLFNGGGLCSFGSSYGGEKRNSLRDKLGLMRPPPLLLPAAAPLLFDGEGIPPIYGVIGDAHIGGAAGLYALTDGGRGVLTGVTLVRESGRESHPTPTASMSNVECGNSSSKSVLKKLLLSEEGAHSSEDELGLLRGDTIELIEAAGPMPVLPPATIPTLAPRPDPPEPGAPPPGPVIPPDTLMLPPVMPPPLDPPPPSILEVLELLLPVPALPPLSTLDISGPPILLTPCVIWAI
uniref:Uncharacterized protein n=1 Tax=Anopheles minimus TaxID=112268 RepID=A0A182VTX7_9DIPT